MSEDPEWMEGIVEETAIVPEEPRRQLSKAEETQMALRSLEDDMLQKSMEVVGGAINFADVAIDELGDPIKPDGWTDRQFRIAKAGMMSAKDAPVAIKLAAQMVTGIVKARATEKGAGRTLNLVQVKFTLPREKYEIIDVDS